MRNAVLAMAVSISVGAPAQVVRCVDPETKAVTYTDAGCASNQQRSVVARKPTWEETYEQEWQAALARQRVEREIAALRRRQNDEERAALIGRRAVDLGPQAGLGPTASAGRLECQRARRDLETRQSSISRKKNDNDISGLLSVNAACGIDASKYIVDPPTEIHLNNPGRYDVRLEESRRRRD